MDIVVHELALMLTVLAAGELTGAAEYCLDASIRYLKERVQFGKPIGANQSLRHLVADDWVRAQGMRAACEYAAAAFDAATGKAGGSTLPVESLPARRAYREGLLFGRAHVASPSTQCICTEASDSPGN